MWIVTITSHTFGRKCISRNVFFWKLCTSFVGTKHVCISAGALGLLGEVSLNKLAEYLKQMMITADSFYKSFLHCLEQASRDVFVVQMNYL